MGLFSVLKTELHPHPLVSQRQRFADLSLKLNTGIPNLSEALNQLEAVGLVKSYQRTDEMGELIVLELQSTLTPAQFIKDDLLSVQLLQMVGEQRFHELADMSTMYSLNIDDYKNVTSAFFDVFHPDELDNSGSKQALSAARDSVDKLTRHRVSQEQVVNNDNFDFKFLNEQLENQGIDTSIIDQYHHLILVEHRTYGYDELQLAKLITKAVSVVNGQFDVNHFKTLSRNAANVNKEVPETRSKTINQLDMAGLPTEVQELLAECETQTPMAFLAQLKSQTNGYVSSSERYTVERLVSQSKLGNGAINLLLWYIIGEQGLATVKASLADAIANNWSRAQVKNSLDAYHEIEKHQAARRNNRSQNNYYSRRQKKTIQEKLPEWAKDDYHPKYTPVSDEKVAKSNEEVAKSKKILAELRKKQKSKK